MKLTILNESLVNQRSDSIILTIDGTSKGMEGKTARVFGELYPKTWRLIENQVQYPVLPGNCVSIPIPNGNPFKVVCLASTLLHSDNQLAFSLKSIALNAYTIAVRTICSYSLKTVRCGLPTGGWRIDPLNAFLIISEVLDKTYASTKGMELQLCIPDKHVFDSVMRFAVNLGFE